MCAQPLHVRVGDGLGLVGRVIQDLNLKPAGRIVQVRNRIQKAIGDGGLVEQRELDGNQRQFFLRHARRTFVRIQLLAMPMAKQD